MQATRGGFASMPRAMTYCRDLKISKKSKREVYGVDQRLQFHLGSGAHSTKRKRAFNKLIVMSSYTERL